MEKRKILYISQEISPYVAENHGSLRSRLIPQGVQEQGFEVRTFMPKYGSINERRNQLHEVIRLSGMNIIIDDTDHPLIIKVATLQPTRMQVYFIDNDDYFSRSPIKELETRTSLGDNDERAIFFVRGVVETVKKLRWAPEVIHCTGWLSALAPLLLKKSYNDDPAFRDSKVVVTITSPDELLAPLAERFAEKIITDGISADNIKSIATPPVGFNELMRIAIEYADGVVAGVPDTDPALLDYARSLGRPVLDYHDDPAEAARAYVDLYNSL